MNKKPQTYLGKLSQDPRFQRVYREQSQLLDIAIMIAEVRQRQKMTQQTLARRLKTNQSVISRIERGLENITIKKFFEIAKALGFRVQFKFF